MTFDNLRRGEWCRRRRSGATWHVVESHIEERSITRCGRQMPERDAKSRELETRYAEPTGWEDVHCLVCQR